MRVVSALHTVGARAVRARPQLDEDVLVCGDAADKRAGAELVDAIPGLRCVDAGRLEMARIAEPLTALIIGSTRATRSTPGSGVTGLPDDCGSAPSSSSPAGPAAPSSRAGCSTRSATTLVVIANTGDDVEIHGGHVSPDPDLVTFWLADRIDERGWGLRGDTFAVMDGLRELGEDVWFNLGDRDLALCLRRARRLAEGARLTEAIDEARARARRAGAGAADVRRAGAHVGARRPGAGGRSRSS